jgi:tetratricopeptide (TPR) repeat protein
VRVEASARGSRGWWLVAPIVLAGIGALSLVRPVRRMGDLGMVGYTGCREVWLEHVPRCVFEPDEPLMLWVDHPEPSRVELRVDGTPWQGEVERVEGLDGFRVIVELPPTAEFVDVVFADPSVPPWSLWVTARARASDRGPHVLSSKDLVVGYGEVFAAAQAGDHQAALQRLEALEEHAVRFPKGRANHATLLGIVQWWQGRFYDAAVSLREGVVFATKFDDEGTQKDALPLYAAVLAELGFVDAAGQWAVRALELDRANPGLFECEERAKLRSTLGWVGLLQAVQGGEPFEDARQLLDDGLELVRPGGACEDRSVVPGLLLTLALFELHEGDALGALARLGEVELADATPDQRVRLADARVQALLVASPSAEAVRATLLELEQAVVRTGSAEGYWRLALRRGDFLAAHGDLAGAVAQYRKAEGFARELIELAAVGVGRETAALLHAQSTERLVSTLVGLGRIDDAFDAAREAQARKLHAVSVAVDDPADRTEIARLSATYTGERDRLDRELGEAKESSGHRAEQLRAAVRSSERELAKAADAILRERSKWVPTHADLVPRAEGELLLGLYPMQGGWFVFVRDAQGTDDQWLAGGPRHALDDPLLGQELLEPWSERLHGASKVRVLASGRAQRADVHLLAWGGAALIERKQVVYGAELPALEHDSNADPLPRRALLVADPTHDLSGPLGEVAAVGGALVKRGWDLGEGPLLRGEADRERVIRELKGVDLFYYAGHAVHDDAHGHGLSLPPYAGGTPAWPARLELALETKLEIPEILTLTSVPRHVVLNGCQTGVPSGVGEGMSLALAFLVAGAEEVVATLDAERDELGLAVGEGLAIELSSDAVGLAQGLQRAQAKMLGRGEPVGRYRVWVR